MVVYFNRKFLLKEQVTISPDDRGFLFADGLYEVIRSYNGVLFKAREHLRRLNYGAGQLNLQIRDFTFLEGVAAELILQNKLEKGATVYIQVTRGTAVRGHAFPNPAPEPTVYAAASVFDPGKTRVNQENGIPVITVPDQRWARCDMKTVGLTAYVLAHQQAVEKGAKEALFVRDGVVLEGTHSNFMAVFDGCLVTAPATNYILHGVTRKAVLEICRREEVPFVERPIQLSDLANASEAIITGTTTQITPVVSINGKPVGSGQPGSIVRSIQAAFALDIKSG